jgi:hypothetical protein
MIGQTILTRVTRRFISRRSGVNAKLGNTAREKRSGGTLVSPLADGINIPLGSDDPARRAVVFCSSGEASVNDGISEVGR